MTTSFQCIVTRQLFQYAIRQEMDLVWMNKLVQCPIVCVGDHNLKFCSMYGRPGRLSFIGIFSSIYITEFGRPPSSFHIFILNILDFLSTV